MKKIFYIQALILITLLVACNEEQLNGEKNTISVPSVTNSTTFSYVDSAHIDQHVIIYDCLTRSLDSSDYVKEIYVVNFDNSKILTEVISFDDKDFADDGLGNDETEGDGIYTSMSVYSHDVSNPFSTLDRESVYDYYIGGTNFQHNASLISHSPPSGSGMQAKAGGSIKIKCKIGTCPCTSCYCLACSLYGGFSCWYPYDCEFEIGASF